MKKTKKSHPSKLDEDEKDLLSSFEKGEWKSIKDLKKGKLSAKKTAARTLRKNIRINIRLAENDLSNLKQIAEFEGLPYQTLISSILHKYAAGHLPNFLR